MLSTVFETQSKKLFGPDALNLNHKHKTEEKLSKSLMPRSPVLFQRSASDCHEFPHTMDLLWEKFQWILPLYMKPISFQSKASVVCSVTTAIFICLCLKKVNVFSQHISKKTNEYLNFTEQITRNWNVDQLSVLRPGMGVQIWKKLIVIMDADFWYLTWWKASRK